MMGLRLVCVLLFFSDEQHLISAFLSPSSSILVPSIEPLRTKSMTGFRSPHSTGSMTMEKRSPTKLCAVGMETMNSDVVVFAVGLVPFVWAGIEFQRRVLSGESFGTGKTGRVKFKRGIDREETADGGARVLGDGALALAYILFAIAIGVVTISLASVMSEFTGPG